MKGLMFMNAAACLVALSGTASAQDAAFELPRASAAYVGDGMPFYLAANDSEAAVKATATGAAPEIRKSDFEPAIFSGSNAHEFLGLSTVVLAGLTAMTAPDGCERNCASKPRETNGTHAQLAKATVAMAAATITAGLIAHWDDFHMEDGLADPDNLHVLLGVTGAAMMAYAVDKSAHSSVPVSHAGIAEAGALGMLLAIKLTW